jgi:hypothetical protein
MAAPTGFLPDAGITLSQNVLLRHSLGDKSAKPASESMLLCSNPLGDGQTIGPICQNPEISCKS